MGPLPPFVTFLRHPAVQAPSRARAVSGSLAFLTHRELRRTNLQSKAAAGRAAVIAPYRSCPGQTLRRSGTRAGRPL